MPVTTRSQTRKRLQKEKAEKAKEAERNKAKRINVKTASQISNALKGRNSYDNKAIGLLQSLKSTKVTQQQIEDCRKCVNKKKDRKKCKTVCENVDEDDINKLTEEDIKKIKSKMKSAEPKRPVNPPPPPPKTPRGSVSFKNEPQLKF